MIIKRWSTRAVLIGMLALTLTGGAYLFNHTPLAYAVSCDSTSFICPSGSSSLNSPWDNLDDNASVTGGQDLAHAVTVAPGQTLTFDAGYTRNTSSGGGYGHNGEPEPTNAYSWIIVTGITGSVNVNTSGGSSTVPSDAYSHTVGGVASNSSYPSTDNTAGYYTTCPNFFDANGSHDYGAGGPAYYPTESHYSNPSAETSSSPGTYYGYNYPSGNPDASIDGHVDGGTTCLFHDWSDGRGSDGKVHSATHSFSITVDPASTSAQFCVRTYLSLTNLNRLTARNHHLQCYKVSSTTVSGRVTSNIVEDYGATGTGRGLPFAASDGLTYSKTCDGTHNNALTTNGNGDYSFSVPAGQAFCINAPDTYVGPDGTHYHLKKPVLCRTGDDDCTDTTYGPVDSYQNQVAGTYCDTDTNFPACSDPANKAYDKSADDVYHLYYIPDDAPPQIVKTVSGSLGGPSIDGQSVGLGQTLYYTLTATNPYDANFRNATVLDNIPLNMKQNLADVHIDSIRMGNFDPGGWGPSGQPPRPKSSHGDTWFSSLLTPGPGAMIGGCDMPGVTTDLGLFYGYWDGNNAHSHYDADDNQTDGDETFNCSQSAPGFATEANVFAQFSLMPAYTTLTIQWHGQVNTSADQIGVYPSDQTYCSGGTNHDFSNLLDVMQNCQDFGNGLEGVFNYAQTDVGDALPLGTTTYNPIPGGVGCTLKYSSAYFDQVNTTNSPASPNDCTPPTPIDSITGTPRPGARQVFSDGSAVYSRFQFHFNVTPDNSKQGPGYYSLVDQDCPGGDFTSGGCTGMDPAFNAPGGMQADVAGSEDPSTLYPINGQLIGVQNGKTLPGAPTHKFTAQVQVPGGAGGHHNGDAVTNESCLYQIDYWAVGHPREFKGCSQITLYYYTTVAPIINTNKNNVNAGGDAEGACTAPTGNRQINTNSPSTGRYLVTTIGGNLSGFSSTSGAAIPDYSPYCYQDLKNRLDAYKVTHGSTTVGNNGPAVASALAGANDGDVIEVTVPAGGQLDLPAISNLSKRVTLYVHGSLHLAGNITNAGTLGGSLGVIVDGGDIYIDATVTHLDGYFYTSPTYAGPGNQTAGIINTCAANSTKTIDLDTSTSGGVTQGSGYGPGECSRPLVVDGLLMGTTFRLNRTGNTGPNHEAEYVESLAQLYLLTPPGFSDVASTYVAPTGLKEEPPRY